MYPFLNRITLGLAGAALACAARAEVACPPAPWSLPALRALQQSGWKLADDAARQALAESLLACLADPDPELRDSLAFEALSAWLRSGQLSVATVRGIHGRLLERLADGGSDPGGFAQPFAVLALAEVARVDRLQPFLSSAERAALVDAGSAYMRAVVDYRGFVPGEGWRHGVAHAADLLLQLSLNPALERPQLEQIVAAVATQVAPPGGHFYIHGESERLVRPVLFVARRALLDQALWDALLLRLASPAPLANWEQAFTSPGGLARVHNTRAFLLALYFQVQNDPRVQPALAPGLLQALKQLP